MRMKGRLLTLLHPGRPVCHVAAQGRHDVAGTELWVGPMGLALEPQQPVDELVAHVALRQFTPVDLVHQKASTLRCHYGKMCSGGR